MQQERQNGFDAGIKCLAAVFILNILAGHLLPVIVHTHDRLLISLSVIADVSMMAAVFATSLYIFFKYDRFLPPPRIWALGIAIIWSLIELVLWAHTFYQSREAKVIPQFAPMSLPSSSFRDNDGEAILVVGAVQIHLPASWEILSQPQNFFVQQRARDYDEGIAVSAGSFQIALSLEQYVAIAIEGFTSGPDFFQKFSEFTGTSPDELEKAAESQMGQRMVEEIKSSMSAMNVELLNVNKLQLHGVTVYDVHSKITLLKSNQVIFNRQITLQGPLPNEIVNITFVGSSSDIFQDQSLLNAIDI